MAGLAETITNSVKLKLKLRLSLAITTTRGHWLIQEFFVGGGKLEKRTSASVGLVQIDFFALFKGIS